MPSAAFSPHNSSQPDSSRNPAVSAGITDHAGDRIIQARDNTEFPGSSNPVSQIIPLALAHKVSWLIEGVPSVFDMDIGKDPDDTITAALVGLNIEHFKPALLLTNDESESNGRARFLEELTRRLGAKVRVAAGLPSDKHRKTTLVEESGMIGTSGGSFEADGIAALMEILEQHSKINYFGLGALTNLAEALRRRPDFAERVNLIQMGLAFSAGYVRSTPQYNVKLDVQSFRSVFERVTKPTFLMTHTSWGSYDQDNPASRQQIGVYPGDPVHQALEKSDNDGLRLAAEHLTAWKTVGGKDCSIMHDPLTVLSQHDAGLVDYAEGNIILKEGGFSDLTAETKAALQAKPSLETSKVSSCLTAQEQPGQAAGLTRAVRFSLGAAYRSFRQRLVEALFGHAAQGLAEDWETHNSKR